MNRRIISQFSQALIFVTALLTLFPRRVLGFPLKAATYTVYSASSTVSSSFLHSTITLSNVRNNLKNVKRYKSHRNCRRSNYSKDAVDGEGDASTFRELENVKKHYACPSTTVESLRQRYGHRQSLWGEWTNSETRIFYRTQLPRALEIDGALGLSLEERAQLASEARRALRIYSRERCHLPGRLVAKAYDGFRHLIAFGCWAQDGMTWSEIKDKYAKEASKVLGPSASRDEIELFMYKMIVDRACTTTNPFFDKLADSLWESSGLYIQISRDAILKKLKTKVQLKRHQKSKQAKSSQKRLQSSAGEVKTLNHKKSSIELDELKALVHRSISEVSNRDGNAAAALPYSVFEQFAVSVDPYSEYQAESLTERIPSSLSKINTINRSKTEVAIDNMMKSIVEEMKEPLDVSGKKIE